MTLKNLAIGLLLASSWCVSLHAMEFNGEYAETRLDKDNVFCTRKYGTSTIAFESGGERVITFNRLAPVYQVEKKKGGVFRPVDCSSEDAKKLFDKLAALFEGARPHAKL